MVLYEKRYPVYVLGIIKGFTLHALVLQSALLTYQLNKMGHSRNPAFVSCAFELFYVHLKW